MNGSVAMIEHVARHLSPLSMEVVFVGGAVVRLLVTDPSVTEFRTTHAVKLPSGASVRIIDPVVFIATKIEAFSQRGNNDPIGSRDIEDVISVVDGRPDLHGEFQTAAASVRTFVRHALAKLINTVGFRNAVLGYLPRSPKAQQRYETIMHRFQTITDMNNDH